MRKFVRLVAGHRAQALQNGLGRRRRRRGMDSTTHTAQALRGAHRASIDHARGRAVTAKLNAKGEAGLLFFAQEEDAPKLVAAKRRSLSPQQNSQGGKAILFSAKRQ